MNFSPDFLKWISNDTIPSISFRMVLEFNETICLDVSRLPEEHGIKTLNPGTFSKTFTFKNFKRNNVAKQFLEKDKAPVLGKKSMGAR